MKEIADGCSNVLDKLEKTLDRYGELKSSPESVGKKVKRVWKRLKWEPEDIRELRSRIVANIILLNTFQGRLASQLALATKDGVDRLHERQDNRERREELQTILDWLTPMDYAPQQSDFIGRRQAGTGQWLLDSAEFQAWLKTDKQTLCCPGIPGAGKTIITAIVVNDLCARFQNDASIGIAYLYCTFRRQHEQKPEDLLASLLKQLLQEQSTVPDKVKVLYDRHKNERTRPLLDEISKALHSVVSNYSRVFLCIDALDESQTTDGCRTRFLSEIFNLQDKTGTSLFATSRFIPEIMQSFEGSMSLEIRASNDDVRRYLDGHMSQLPAFVGRSPDLQEEIKAEIIKAVDGMFLLAQLHFGSLIGKKSPKVVRAALKKLPTGSETYDYAYKDAMERIEEQVADAEELAKQTLSWITCAKRPLTTAELQHALATEIGESEFDEENFTDIKDVVSVCAGLVTIDKKSDIIRLVHYTTQEYFQRTWTSWFPNAERDIATTCLAYLSFNTFETEFYQTDGAFSARLQSNILYDYAARNWGCHARGSPEKEIQETILNFLKDSTEVLGAIQAMRISAFTSHFKRRHVNFATNTLGLWVAAFYGLQEIVKVLLDTGNSVGTKDSCTSTALHAAASNGQEAVIRLLLERNANIDAKNFFRETPLYEAAHNGHDTVVQLLIDSGADIESRDRYRRTALHAAAWRGYESTVRMLLERGANITAKDNDQYEAIHVAADSGYGTILRLLLENEADTESRSKYGDTTLHLAAASGHVHVLRLLLEYGAETDAKTNRGRTVLHDAVTGGYEEVILLLLEEGVAVNVCDDEGVTPLHEEVECGYYPVAKLLLDHGADVTIKNGQGFAALDLALEREQPNEAIVRLLREKEADIASQVTTELQLAAREQSEDIAAAGRVVNAALEDVLELDSMNGTDRNSAEHEDGKLADTATHVVTKIAEEQITLHEAAKAGSLTEVQLLLDNGAAITARDNKGWTPLHWAAFRGHESVVLLLLEKGQDVNMKNIAGRTALHLAARNGHDAVAGLLIQKNAAVTEKDDCDVTALHLAAHSGNTRLVRRLLMNGADIAATDENGWSPLHVAVDAENKPVVWLLLKEKAAYKTVSTTGLASSCHGDLEVVQMLLENGACDTTRNLGEWTVLHWAASNGHEAVVRLLLEKGADIEAVNEIGMTALHCAAFNGHERVVRLLLGEGADMNAVTCNQISSVELATIGGHEALTRLLLGLGANVIGNTMIDWKVIHTAAEIGYTKAITLIFCKMVGFNAHVDVSEIWPFRAVCTTAEVVRLLIENGGDFKAKTSGGWTVLHWAASNGHEALEEMMLQRGADVEACRIQQTALFDDALNEHGAILASLPGQGINENMIRTFER